MKSYPPIIKSTMAIIGNYKVDSGWSNIVSNAFEKMKELEPDVKVLMVTKYDATGLLAIVVSHTSISKENTGAIVDIIDEATDESATVCEVCGEKGHKVGLNGYLEIRCDSHKSTLPNATSNNFV
jgi:hypothetical protein